MFGRFLRLQGGCLVRGAGLALTGEGLQRVYHEDYSLRFRAEFFNAFNTPQFGNPGTNVNSSTFGIISSTSVNPRIIQFALKLNF